MFVRSLQLASLLLLGSAIPALAAPSCTSAGAERVNVGDHHLWIETAGAGTPTVVFENGNGSDATVWEKVAPEIRWKSRVRTVVYDRAGQGQSEAKPGAKTEDEAAALKRALDLCSVRGPVVLVAQADGSAVASQLAANDKRIAAVVLVESKAAASTSTNLPVADVANGQPVLREKPDAVVEAVGQMVEKVRERL